MANLSQPMFESPPFKNGDLVRVVQETHSIRALDLQPAVTLKRLTELTVKSTYFWERIPAWLITFEEVRGHYSHLYFEKIRNK
jgi:hypothetical protein